MLNAKSFGLLIKKKSGLLKCIFSTLIIQMLVTSVVVFMLYKTKKLHIMFNLFTFLIILFLNISLIFLMISQNITFNKRVFYFTIFSILNGLIVSSLTRYFRVREIMSALLSVLIVFILFFIFGAITVKLNIDLSFLGLLLFVALIVLIVRYIIMFIYPVNRKTYLFWNTIGIVIFSLFIMYDTNKILVRYEDTEIDCVRGALDYYLDIINLFIRFLGRKR